MKYTPVFIFLFLPALAFAANVQEIRKFDLSIQGIDVLVVNCGAGILDIKGFEDRDKIRVTAEIEVEDGRKEDLQKFIERNVRLSMEKKDNKVLLISNISEVPRTN